MIYETKMQDYIRNLSVEEQQEMFSTLSENLYKNNFLINISNKLFIYKVDIQVVCCNLYTTIKIQVIIIIIQYIP